LSDMSQSEREAFRLGAMQKLYDESKKVTEGGSAYKRLFNSPDKAEKIKAMLQDDDAFDRLSDVMKREDVFNKTYAATTQGSQTARRLAGANELAVDPSSMYLAATQPQSIPLQLLNKAKVLNAPRESQRDELSRLLMTPGPRAQQAISKVYDPNIAGDANLRRLAQFLAIGPSEATGAMMAP